MISVQLADSKLRPPVWKERGIALWYRVGRWTSQAVIVAVSTVQTVTNKSKLWIAPRHPTFYREAVRGCRSILPAKSRGLHNDSSQLESRKTSRSVAKGEKETNLWRCVHKVVSIIPSRNGDKASAMPGASSGDFHPELCCCSSYNATQFKCWRCTTGATCSGATRLCIPVVRFRMDERKSDELSTAGGHWLSSFSIETSQRWCESGDFTFVHGRWVAMIQEEREKRNGEAGSEATDCFVQVFVTSSTLVF